MFRSQLSRLSLGRWGRIHCFEEYPRGIGVSRRAGDAANACCGKFICTCALSLILAKNSTRLAVPRNPEHRIVFDDLLSALEHELHAPEVAERGPATLGV